MSAQKNTDLLLQRLGRGISYHDVRLALGDQYSNVVGDGFDPQIAHYKHINIEELLLAKYFEELPEPPPIGYARESLDLVLRRSS